jgi:hypothetical protein
LDEKFSKDTKMQKKKGNLGDEKLNKQNKIENSMENIINTLDQSEGRISGFEDETEELLHSNDNKKKKKKS